MVEAPDAPYRTCSLTDRFPMFVDTENVPSVRTSYQVLDKFGVVTWTLPASASVAPLDRAFAAFAYVDSRHCELTTLSSKYVVDLVAWENRSQDRGDVTTRIDWSSEQVKEITTKAYDGQKPGTV